MFLDRVNRFNTITKSMTLLNKNIQQIDLCLLEAHLVNTEEALFVNGTIRRQIRFQEYDGRLRKIDDQIQFAICTGKSVTEPVSLLKVDLKQDYFIFQPSQIGENAAILKQGFLLTVCKMDNETISLKGKTLRVNSIIKKGQDSIMVKIPIKSPVPLIQPKSFSGKVRFINCNELPIVDAEINGVLIYRNTKNLIQEIYLCEAVSLLVNASTPSSVQSFLIYGTINDVCWQREPAGQSWYMELKLDYHWYLIEPKELFCVEQRNEPGALTEQISTTLVLESSSFDFAKIQLISLSELAVNIQLDLEQVSYENKFTKKGLLLSAVLSWGIIFINKEGFEQYQEFKTQFEELFSSYSEGQKDDNLTLAADLKVKLVSFEVAGYELKIVINCQYNFKTYGKQITSIIEDSASPELIYAKTMVGKESFSLTASNVFGLTHIPLRVIGVKAKLGNVRAEVKNGWITVNGQLDVNIAYVDRERVLREDVFPSFFREHHIWDKLIDLMEVEISSNLDYDSYHLMNSNISYQYLVSISVAAFYEKELRILTVNNPIHKAHQRTDMPNNETSPRSSVDKVLIEAEMPLFQRNLKQIETSRALLSSFDYQISQKAILINGNLRGELEYWDDKNYLQKVTIDLPFWRFIRNDFGVQLDGCKLIPEVRKCSYTPSQTWPWRKQSLKICFELAFDQT